MHVCSTVRPKLWALPRSHILTGFFKIITAISKFYSFPYVSPPPVSFLLPFPSLPQVAAGLQEVFFKTLDDLIHHYKKKNQGLAIHLRYSVKRKTFLLRSPQRAAEVPPPEEDHDYESTSCALLPHSHFLITSAWLDLSTLFSSRCSWVLGLRQSLALLSGSGREQHRHILEWHF